MGISFRMFLFDESDGLYHLPSAKFGQMLREPTSYRFTRFAGSRVRLANVAVELLNRQPIRVVRLTFGFITFDDDGCFDASAFDVHQRARAELALDRSIKQPKGGGIVIDAASRFVAHGGCWTPSSDLQQLIYAAALGKVKCTRL